MSVTDERMLRMMQEKLDDMLLPQEEPELERLLRTNPEAGQQFERLQKVDEILQSAPHERAPERLALTIMARLGESVMELQRQQEQQSETAEAMMRVAMTTVAIATLPLMVGAAHLILNAQSKPEVFEQILAQVAGLMLMVIDVMKVMLAEAQEAYQTNPEAAMAMIALIPVTLLALVRQILGREDDEEEQ